MKNVSTTLKEMHRVKYIDALKGLAIIMVVIGHSIQGSPYFDENIIFRIINSSHVQLFMFLSGYLAFGKTVNLKRKFNFLVIPYLSWYPIQYMAISVKEGYFGSFLDYIIHGIKYPDDGLWFLWALFLNFVLLKVSQRFSNNKLLYGELFTSTVLLLFIRGLPTGLFGIGFVKWHYIFFSAGYFYKMHLSKYVSKLSQRHKVTCSIFIVLLFTLVSTTWRRFDNPSFWFLIQDAFIRYNLPGISHVLTWYLISVPFIGIACAFILVPKNNNMLQKFLVYIGSYSFEIYIIHQYVMISYGINYAKNLIETISGISLSILIAILIKKNNYINMLLLGNKQ